jgi:tetratricopeptide (TPR) repeat protein
MPKKIGLSGGRINIRRITPVILIILALAGGAGVFLLIDASNNGPAARRAEALASWNAGDYEKTRALTEAGLAEAPVDSLFLMLNGFAAYETALTQVDNQQFQDLLDASIRSLRKALLTPQGGADPAVRYVLGKAYYYKGRYWADESVKYLEEARTAYQKSGGVPDDMAEYLGLVYAQVKNWRKSVENWTEALNPAMQQDLLLLNIARAYRELDENDQARAYLTRCIDETRDDEVKIEAELLDAGILAAKGDSENAEERYLAALDAGGENARARYELGELYAAEGNTVKARAEWRKAVRADPAFEPARRRLAL